MPDPAGALITDTRRPSVSAENSAAAWSSRSPAGVRLACVSRAGCVSAASSCVTLAPSSARGLVACHRRRALRLGLREEPFLHRQLHAGRVPDAAVPLVHAAPVRAHQVARHGHRFGRLQADHRLELARQRPVGQFLQQPRGGVRVHAGARQ